ncbi:flavodoxin family protein [Paenibacillus sp. YN15]|uniref:flavodoxin family protein n=1 Tax=Paenibacillus sp. YN15 TaxID=1742774 RepID=UPI000DCB8690|nr:flavodoxin family protein [Paenibacillus sp. YN15]RAU92589.1 flavodoxin family protein [Paenibacillus sp. YN15]
MKMIIHDLPRQEDTPNGHLENQGTRIISDNGTIRKCVGCFDCWTRTPGVCIMRDDYQQMGEWLAGSDEVVIISKCTYGGYSPFVKNVLDRSISYLLPYFAMVNGETHHQRRYPGSFKLTVHFYGSDLTSAEQDTARALVAANALNLHSTGNGVHFHRSADSVWEGLQ